MNREFTRQLFEWLDGVCTDRRLWPAAFKLAWAIGQHINRSTGTAWPSQATLAAAIGADVRTVRRLTDQLVKAGHLHVEANRGRNQTSVYRIAENRTPASGLDAEITGQESPLINGEKPGVHVHKNGHLRPKNRTSASEKPGVHVHKTGHLRPKNRTSASEKPGVHVRQTIIRTIEEPSEEQRESTRASSGGAASRIAANWSPSEDDFAFALSEGLTEQECERQAERFRDYWIGSGKLKTDWRATWRNWIRREVDGRKAKPGKPSMVAIALKAAGWNQ